MIYKSNRVGPKKKKPHVRDTLVIRFGQNKKSAFAESYSLQLELLVVESNLILIQTNPIGLVGRTVMVHSCTLCLKHIREFISCRNTNKRKIIKHRPRRLIYIKHVSRHVTFHISNTFINKRKSAYKNILLVKNVK